MAQKGFNLFFVEKNKLRKIPYYL